jgi:hypothetical protein
MLIFHTTFKKFFLLNVAFRSDADQCVVQGDPRQCRHKGFLEKSKIHSTGKIDNFEWQTGVQGIFFFTPVSRTAALSQSPKRLEI